MTKNDIFGDFLDSGKVAWGQFFWTLRKISTWGIFQRPRPYVKMADFSSKIVILWKFSKKISLYVGFAYGKELAPNRKSKPDCQISPRFAKLKFCIRLLTQLGKILGERISPSHP